VSSTRTSQSVQELRQLIAMLERSGIAEQRPEARALLLRSRAMLRERQRGTRRLSGKLATLATLAMDAGMLAAATMLLLAGPPSLSSLSLAAAPMAWFLVRLRHQAKWLAEAARWAAYHIAWLRDWFAEALSLAAMERLDARIAAREVMRDWRRHRRALPHRASLEDVAAFLDRHYGIEAARAFRQEAEGLSQGPLRRRPAHDRAARRLAALRWSALIVIFGRLARRGALWPEVLPAGLPPGAADWPGAGAGARPDPLAGALAPPPPPAEAADMPERAARRADLREMIRRKRQDITTAFGWHMKTEAEITQRDHFLAQTRAEIAELERELAALGG
jgi:hypothetical protein